MNDPPSLPPGIDGGSFSLGPVTRPEDFLGRFLRAPICGDLHKSRAATGASFEDDIVCGEESPCSVQLRIDGRPVAVGLREREVKPMEPNDIIDAKNDG